MIGGYKFPSILSTYLTVIFTGTKTQPEIQGKKRTGPQIKRAALRVLFNTLLPLYGFLFTLIFFSVGLKNYYRPDIPAKLFQ